MLNLAAVLLMMAAVWLSPAPQPGAGFLALAVGALLLELRAVRLPGFGFFSAGPALTLAALLVPTLQGAGGAFLALVALLARTARWGSPTAASVDLVPLLVSATALGALRFLPAAPWVPYIPWVLVPALYLAASGPLARRAARRLQPETWLEWLRVWRTVASLRVAVVVSALPLALLVQRWPAAILLALPLLLVTHAAAENAFFRVQARAASQVLAADRYQQEVLDRAHQEIDSARRELEATRQQRDRLDELTRALAELAGLEPALELVLRAVSQSLPFRSAAIFLPREGELSPARFLSPDAERLRDARLLGLREPLVDKVWAMRRPWLLSEELGRSPRLFEAERCALALPLREAGVLYVGRERDPFSPEECRYLSWVAARAGLALTTGARQSAQLEALQAGERERSELAAQVALLAALAEGSRAVSEGLDPDRILASFQSVLTPLVPHDGGGVWLAPGAPRRAWGGSLEGAAPVLQALVEQGRPLLLAEPARLQLPGYASLLGVPIPGPGAVLLAARAPGAFSRSHQELLLLLGHQLALALSNAHHYRALEQSQAQLIQSSKMTAVGQLAAGVAHELNTPLAAIVMSVESALVRPDKAARKLERVLDSSRRCQQIVEKLMIYTRLSSTRQMRLQPSQLLHDTLDFFGLQLAEAGFEVALELAETPEVQGRPQDLQQVLINLLLNAREAAVEGRPRRLVLSTGMRQDRVVMAVRDWGEGIAPEVLPRIFEPFFTTRPVGKGTGLGLSVSHEIVAQHGGTLEVQSQPGEGATFSVLLPVAPAPAP